MKSFQADGDDVGAAAAESGAEQAAVREAEESLHQLVGVAADLRRGERVQPDVDADPDVAERVVAEDGAAREQHQPDDDPGRALGRDVEQRQEDPEEQQRGAEVLDDDEDQQAGDPGERAADPCRGRGATAGRGTSA